MARVPLRIEVTKKDQKELRALLSGGVTGGHPAPQAALAGRFAWRPRKP